MTGRMFTRRRTTDAPPAFLIVANDDRGASINAVASWEMERREITALD